MNKYPDWLPEDLKERYDKVNSLPEGIKNDTAFNLLLWNPNYENIGNYGTAKEKMKIGEEYILGRAHTSGEYEGHIDWRRFTPSSPEEIDQALFPGIFYVMKKK